MKFCMAGADIPARLLSWRSHGVEAYNIRANFHVVVIKVDIVKLVFRSAPNHIDLRFVQ